jgi:hypothetical protein
VALFGASVTFGGRAPACTAGCNTGANVYTSDFFSEPSYETELNHNWQVHGISIFPVL